MKQDKKEQRERVRKAYAPAGVTTQKMMSLRVDLENVEWLQQQRNKGRYINDLIAADRQRARNGDSHPGNTANEHCGAETGGIGGG